MILTCPVFIFPVLPTLNFRRPRGKTAIKPTAHCTHDALLCHVMCISSSIYKQTPYHLMTRIGLAAPATSAVKNRRSLVYNFERPHHGPTRDQEDETGHVLLLQGEDHHPERVQVLPDAVPRKVRDGNSAEDGEGDRLQREERLPVQEGGGERRGIQGALEDEGQEEHQHQQQGGQVRQRSEAGDQVYRVRSKVQRRNTVVEHHFEAG